MKRLLHVVTLCLVILSSINLIKASDSLLIDQADILTASEERRLLNDLEALEENYHISSVIVIRDSLNGQSSTSYADDYYDNHNYLPDGILFLISLSEREYAISTTGSCIRTFTDQRLINMEDAFMDDLSSGDYYGAFQTYIQYSDHYLTNSSSISNDYDYDYDYGYDYDYDYDYVLGYDYDYVLGISVSCMIGFVIALIVTGIMRSKLKTIRRQNNAENYIAHEDITQHQDMYLYRHVSRMRKPEPKSNGSSIHISSSGRSHGGRSG